MAANAYMQRAHVLRPVPVAVGLLSREDMESDGSGGSKAERFVQEQLATQRRNLLGICKYVCLLYVHKWSSSKMTLIFRRSVV